MSTVFSRHVGSSTVEKQTEVVREHLSSCCDPDDDPRALADEVSIRVEEDGDDIKVIGWIDRDPVAEYLR